MVIVTCVVVIMRYGLDMGSVLLQDVVLYLHGGLFLLGSAFALKRGAHVRVDVFYRGFSDLRKAWVDLLGNIIFLQPVCWMILFYSWGYVEFSWRIMEVSPEPDGLPFHESGDKKVSESLLSENAYDQNIVLVRVILNS